MMGRKVESQRHEVATEFSASNCGIPDHVVWGKRRISWSTSVPRPIANSCQYFSIQVAFAEILDQPITLIQSSMSAACIFCKIIKGKLHPGRGYHVPL